MITVGVLLLFLCKAAAQSNDDCLMCHDDDKFTMEKNGRTVSIDVNEKKYNNSKHSKLKCTSCHINFDDEEIPHSNNLNPKSCGDCHQKQIIKHLLKKACLVHLPVCTATKIL